MRRVAMTCVGLASLLAGCFDGSGGSASSDLTTNAPTVVVTTTSPRVPEDWEILYAQIHDRYVAAQNGDALPVDHQFGPTVDRAKAAESIVAYENATKPWVVLLGDRPVTPIAWAIMSENDYDWWRELVAEQEGPDVALNWDPDTNMFGHCRLNSIAFCGYTNQYRPETPEHRILQYSVIGSRYTGEPNANTVNHEATHWYQFSVIGRFPDDTPCWYVEGQATLYGGALQYDVVNQRGTAIGQRNSFKSIVRKYQPDADELDAERWVDVLEVMFQPDVSCGPTQDYFKYAVGLFNWEFLQATYGTEVMHQVLLDFADGATYADAVRERLGTTPEELNLVLAQHLVHVFAEGH